ncbi:MAG: PEP/pyruvate-binding domain-containing protein, partial [bacterium]
MERGDELSEWVRTLDSVGSADGPQVGGKNASLGEMIGALSERGIRVPRGFATTAAAYRRFVEENELLDGIEKAVAA